MTALHLPVAHTQDDLALAGALAQILESDELFVAWSTDGGPARPVVGAIIEFADEPGRPRTLLERLREFWRAL